MLKHEYNYEEYNRVDVNGKRHYNVGGIPIPSVTTILSETSDKSFLDEWRNNIGHKEADLIVEQSSRLGSDMHDNLERYIKYGDTKFRGAYIAKMMTKIIIDKAFKKIDYFVGSEVAIYNDQFYAGTADAICYIDGKLTVVDFKNSRKIKDIEHVRDYFLQAMAYIEGHNYMFGTNCKDAIILMASQDGKYSEYTIDSRNYNQIRDEWYERLEVYYSR